MSDGTIHIIDLETGEIRTSLDAYRRRVSELAFSDDGDRLYAMGDDVIHVWAVRDQ